MHGLWRGLIANARFTGGLIFGVINVVGNFGTVFLDQSYWQSAIAAKPSATYKGYILGGMCWCALSLQHSGGHVSDLCCGHNLHAKVQAVQGGAHGRCASRDVN